MFLLDSFCSPVIMIKKCSPEKCRSFSRLWQQGLNFIAFIGQLYSYCPELKNLIPVSSMWPIGPIVLVVLLWIDFSILCCFVLQTCILSFNQVECKFYTQFCRIKGCGGAGWPHQYFSKDLSYPQHIIYRRKENLSESPNHKKYWENILVSRFYEQFSRNRRNLGYFRKFEKISNS